MTARIFPKNPICHKDLMVVLWSATISLLSGLISSLFAWDAICTGPWSFNARWAASATLMFISFVRSRSASIASCGNGCRETLNSSHASYRLFGLSLFSNSMRCWISGMKQFPFWYGQQSQTGSAASGKNERITLGNRENLKPECCLIHYAGRISIFGGSPERCGTFQQRSVQCNYIHSV